MRKVARKNFLDAITSPFGECHWCGKVIFWRERAPDSWTPTPYGHERVRVFREGKFEYYALATIDHVESLADGGGNHPFNLVPSCSPCNENKD